MPTTRTTCRVCPGELTDVLELGTQCVVDFPKIGEKSSRPSSPLTLARCNECKLIQLRHTVEGSSLYETFWYRSGINPAMRAALANVTAGVEAQVQLSPSDFVLDIGCNDGTLFETYLVPNLYTVGVDPAGNVITEAKGKAKLLIPEYFSEAIVRDVLSSLGHLPTKWPTCNIFKAITAIAMFYDLEDPNTFVADIVKLLHPDGVFVIQMNYLLSMIQQNAFDNICHEHLEYYTLATLEPVLNKHGLKVVDVSQNDVNGGSLRVYCKFNGEESPQVQALRNAEKSFAAESDDTINAFGNRISEILRIIAFTLEKCPKPVYLYGASTRGTTLMQALNPPSGLIKGAAERDERKFGRMMVNTKIPILDEKEAREDAKTFLLLPWHFWSGIYAREAEWLAKGGTFIKPLPWPTIVTNTEHSLINSAYVKIAV